MTAARQRGSSDRPPCGDDGDRSGSGKTAVIVAADDRRAGTACRSSATGVPPDRTVRTPSPVNARCRPRQRPRACSDLDGTRRSAWHRDDHRAPAPRSARPPRARGQGISGGTRSSSTSAPNALGHLAHARGQTAGSAVGDRRIQVFRTDQHVDQQFLDDRIADLHTCACDLASLASIVADENVAPRMPSRPVAPPSTSTRSPGWGRHGEAAPRRCRCSRRNTSGLVVYAGSYKIAPATVGSPILLP